MRENRRRKRKNESARHVRYGDVLEMHFDGGKEREEELLKRRFEMADRFGWREVRTFNGSSSFLSFSLFFFFIIETSGSSETKEKKRRKEAFDRVDGIRSAVMKNK